MDVLLITGMHRSYTSLLTQYLARCGVFLGDRLLDPTPDNRDGCFEDRDIVTLHARILANRPGGIFSAAPVDSFTPDEQAQIDARLAELRELNTLGQPVAFKDPRACLFLDAWKQACPQARYVFIHREYRQVIASLFRRESDLTIFRSPWSASLAWLAYNACLLEFYARNQARCILIDGNMFSRNAGRCVARLNEKFGLDLAPCDIRTVYKEEYTTHAENLPSLASLAIAPFRERLACLQRELHLVSDC